MLVTRNGGGSKRVSLRNPGAALETVPSPGPLWTRGGSCRGGVCEPGRPGEPGAQADARGSLLVLEQVDPGSLAQALGQLAGLLHQHVRGHNRQVEGQQLVAPDSLGRVALAVIPQELPGGEGGGQDSRGRHGQEVTSLDSSTRLERTSLLLADSPFLRLSPRPSGPILWNLNPGWQGPSYGATEPAREGPRSPAETAANAVSVCNRRGGTPRAPHSLPLSARP